MVLNAEFIGRAYPASAPYLVGREKIREFARAIGEGNPAYFDRDAARALGHPDLIAPPTFATVVAMQTSQAVMFDPELGLDFSRVVHAEQSYAYARPICAGDELIVSTRIENIRMVAGNDMLTTQASIDTIDGEHVVTATSVLVSRGADS
ncbi:MAG: FAS1-like dehydratase domain-containing protein [Candidatus Nanopelagicales bacterium]